MKELYNPAEQGSIDRISYSMDIRMEGKGTPNTIIGYRFLVWQSGVFYAPFSISRHDATPNWQRFSQNNLTEANFVAVVGTGHPDFSAQGPSLRFGFVVLHRDTPNISGIDNWEVRISR
jgi:hypothetical protein